MSNREKILIGSLALLAAFAIGRYSVPTKVLEKSSKVVNSDLNKHTDTIVVETKKADGSSVIETHTVSDSNKVVKLEEEKSTETTRHGGRVRLLALGGASITSIGLPVYGASISTNITGPIVIGGWGISSGVVGVSVGMDF